MRPLDRLTSIKVKLGIVVLGSVVATTVSIFFGWRTGLKTELRILLTAVVFLVVTQWLAHGMTAPLREMAAAARRMGASDWSGWDPSVTTSSRDEVGDLARAFATMATQLAEADRQRRDLVANVSHELRTPITAIQARLENLVDGVEVADEQTLAAMLRSTERLGRLVTQLLDLSRLEAGTIPLDRRRFQVADLLEEAAEESRLGGSVMVSVDAPAGLTATGDPERIHQVVANLLENAVRHAPPDSTVTVRAEAHRTSGVAIEVLDRGPGIAAADAERVFERFYRADSAR